MPRTCCSGQSKWSNCWSASGATRRRRRIRHPEGQVREGGNQIAEATGAHFRKPDLKTALGSMPDDGLVARVQDLMTRKEALERSARQAETESNCRKTLCRGPGTTGQAAAREDTTELQRLQRLGTRAIWNVTCATGRARSPRRAGGTTRLVQLGLWQGNLETPDAEGPATGHCPGGSRALSHLAERAPAPAGDAKTWRPKRKRWPGSSGPGAGRVCPAGIRPHKRTPRTGRGLAVDQAPVPARRGA